MVELLTGLIILILVILVIFCGLYIWYVKIVTYKNKVFETLSGIDVQQKKRSNLIPNILKIAKRFMEHENDLLLNITKLRSKANSNYDKANPDQVKDHLATIESLGVDMGKMMINVENYPELKSDKTMLQAQATYNEVEENIAAARRFYNSSVTMLNNSIQIFPGNILANSIGVKSMPFYQADEQVKAPIDADHFLR